MNFSGNPRIQNFLSRFNGLFFLNKLPLSIRSKITLPFLFLSIVIAIAAGYVITRIVFDTIEERFVNQLVESGKLASEQMALEEDRLLTSLRLLTYTNGVGEALQQGDPDRLRQLTFGAVVNNQEEAVEFLGTDGEHILSIHHREGGRIEEYEFASSKGTLIQWDFVQKVLSQSKDSLGDKFSGSVPAPWGDYFYVAGPIYTQKGEFAGVALVGKSLKTLARKLREETLAQISIYNQDGKVVSSTFISPLDLPSGQAQTVLAVQDRSSLRRDFNRELSVQNIDYGEILGPWEGRGDVDLGVLGVALGKSFLVSTTNITRLQATFLVILTLLMVVLVGLALSYVITHPIIQLVQASRKVSQGDLQVRLEPSSHDELSVLTQTFNQMVSNLFVTQNELVESYDSTLEGWSKALELRDKETEGHALRVTTLTLLMAQELGIKEDQMEHIRRGALLHDIGKMGVPDSILLKPGKLTDDEITVMRQHPVYAHDMLKNIDFLRPALAIPYCHHERWDGSGYPQGLKGEEIPLEARIFAMVDVWDALTSDRPYRAALSKEEAVALIKQGIGTQFDPRVAEVFLRLYEKGLA